MLMKFEYDPEKSNANKLKHGIDFEEAKILWHDTNRLEIAAKTIDETRFMIIGIINDKHWSAVITKRNDTIRIISVRRSRNEEVQYYEGE
jgi:uncharacterized protein